MYSICTRIKGYVAFIVYTYYLFVWWYNKMLHIWHIDPWQKVNCPTQHLKIIQVQEPQQPLFSSLRKCRAQPCTCKKSFWLTKNPEHTFFPLFNCCALRLAGACALLIESSRGIIWHFYRYNNLCLQLSKWSYIRSQMVLKDTNHVPKGVKLHSNCHIMIPLSI